jgi:1-acyl-sn-glycerol-3-phosphate acyltransferase
MTASRSRLGPIGLTVYNLFYWPYLLSSCVVLFFPALVLYALTFWDPRRRILHAYTSLWGAHYLAWAPFAGVELEGRERGLAAGPCVYVSNHQSMVDILAAFATRLPYLWVSKVENFFVPFLGWNMWLSGYVPLRRGNLASIRKMLRRCEVRIRQGASLFVFPEGTRSPDGELKSFYRGAFWVAARYRVPIVPVVIEGTARVLPKRSFRIVPQKVIVRVLSPVHPGDFSWNDRKLRDHVHELMKAELAELRREERAIPAREPTGIGAEAG